MSALGSCADGLSASEAAGMNFSGVGAQPPLEPRCSATVAESVVLIRDRAAPRKSVLAPVEVYAPTPAVQRQLGLDVHRSVKCSALLKGAKVFITWTPPASPGSSSCGSESPPLSGVNLLAEANLLPSFLPRALQLLLCLRQSQSASPLSAVGPKTGSGASPVNGDRRMQLLEAEAVAAFFRGVTVQQVESLRVQLQGPPPHQHLHQAAASAASLGATSPRSLSCSRSEASEGIALLLPDSSVQHLQRQGSALSVLEFDSSSEAAVPSPPPQPPCAGKFSLLVSRSTAAVLAAASTGAFGRFGGLVSASQQLRALAQTVKEAIAAELVWQLRKLLRASALDVCGQANALVNFRRCTDCLVAHWLPVLLGASPQEVLCVLQSQGVTVSEQSLTAPEPLSLQPPKANTFAPSSAAVSLNAQTAPNAAASRNAANGLVLAPAAAEGRAEQRPAAGFLSGDGGKGELTLSCSEVAALENYFMCVEAMQVDSDDPLPEQFQEARCEPFLQALDLSLCLASPSNSLTVSPNSVPADDAFDLGSIEAAKPGRPSPPKTTSASLSSKTPELAAEAPDPRSAVVSKVLRNILGGAAPPADTKPASSRARRGGRGGGSGGGSDGGCSSVGGGVVVAAAGGGGASPMDVQEAKPGAVEGPSLRRPPLQERFSGRGGLTAAERSALHALLYPSSTSTGEGGAQRNGEGGGKGGRRSVPLHLLPGLFNNCPDFVDRALQVGRVGELVAFRKVVLNEVARHFGFDLQSLNDTAPFAWSFSRKETILSKNGDAHVPPASIDAPLFVECNWVNGACESGHPYDLALVFKYRNRTENVFIEVKASLASSGEFSLSASQLDFARANPESYTVLVLGALRSLNPTWQAVRRVAESLGFAPEGKEVLGLQATTKREPAGAAPPAVRIVGMRCACCVKPQPVESETECN